MPRLWVGNFDFEYQLGGHPVQQLPRKLQEINRQLLPALLPLTSPGDLLWSSGAESAEELVTLQRLCEQCGVRMVRKETEIPANVRIQLSPWGWTTALIGWGEQQGWEVMAPEISRVAWANSRKTSVDYEREWEIAPAGAAEYQNLEELERSLGLIETGQRWVIKAEFGMSGRERILGEGSGLTDSQRNWLKKRFDRKESVFFEPWLERVAESSFHYQITPAGEVSYVGQMQLLADACGRYLSNSPLPANEAEDWQESRRWTMRLVEDYARCGYFGPLSIDSMRYRTAGGEIRERPLQDINARWTMGRCAWERVYRGVQQVKDF